MNRSALTIAAAIFLIVAAGGYLALRAAQGPTAGASPLTQVAVSVTDKSCNPNELSVTAGKTTFAIHNASGRALEWEILDGVMVVDERENIAPGFTQTLTTTLQPGDYDVTCGLLTNPKGRLHVAAAAGTAAATKPRLIDLIGPIAEYKVFVAAEADALVLATRAFTDAVKAGDVAKAKALYTPARAHYEDIEPIAELFSDLDAAIDSRADDHEKKEADPGFTGFHRIEYGLWTANSSDGLNAIADKLLADVTELQGRIATLTVAPDKMVSGAADLIEEVAASKISGEEDRYSHTDLADFQANVDGAQKIVALLRPLTVKADRTLSDKIDANFTAVDTILGRYRAADGGFPSYDALQPADRTALQGPITTLAEDLARLSGTLGLGGAT